MNRPSLPQYFSLRRSDSAVRMELVDEPVSCSSCARVSLVVLLRNSSRMAFFRLGRLALSEDAFFTALDFLVFLLMSSSSLSVIGNGWVAIGSTRSAFNMRCALSVLWRAELL